MMFAVTKGDRFFDDWKVRRHYLAKGLDDVKRAFWWKQLVSILEYKKGISFTYSQAQALLADTSIAGSHGLVPLCLAELLNERIKKKDLLPLERVERTGKRTLAGTRILNLIQFVWATVFMPFVNFLLDVPSPCDSSPLALGGKEAASCVLLCSELCELRLSKLQDKLQRKNDGAVAYHQSFLFLWTTDNASSKDRTFPNGFVLRERLPLVGKDADRFLQWLKYKGVVQTKLVFDSLLMVKLSLNKASPITPQEQSLFSLTILTHRAKSRVQKMQETKRLLQIQANENRTNGLISTAEWCEAQIQETDRDISNWNQQLDKTMLATTKVRFENHGQASAQQQQRWAEQIETWLKLLKDDDKT